MTEIKAYTDIDSRQELLATLISLTEEERFQEAADILETLPDEEMDMELKTFYGTELNNIGMMDYEVDEPERIMYIEKAIEVLSSVEEEGRLDDYWNARMGFAYYSMGHSVKDEKFDYYLKALPYFERWLDLTDNDDDIDEAFEVIEECRANLATLCLEDGEAQDDGKSFWEKLSILGGILPENRASIDLMERINNIESLSGIDILSVEETRSGAEIVTFSYFGTEYDFGIGITDFDPESMMWAEKQKFSDEEMDRIMKSNKSVEFTMLIQDRPLESFHMELKLLYAMFPDLLGVYGESQERLFNMKWIKMKAESRVRPLPTDLFTVQTVHDGEGTFWVHTHGLMPFGLTELEILGVDHYSIRSMISLLETFAVRLIENSYETDYALEENVYNLGVYADGTPIVATKLPWQDGVKLYEDGECIGLAQDREESHNADTSIVFLYKNKYDFNHGILTKPAEFSMKLDDNSALFIGNMTTMIMSRLAVENIGYLKRAVDLASENPDMGIFNTVKIAINVTNNGRKDFEHIWFEILEMDNNYIMKGRLLQEPFLESQIHKGDVETYPVTRLTDWQIFMEDRVITPGTAYLMEIVDIGHVC